ncbi:4'-phosphopantetheinyl transferase family protein [Leptospira interrogans]
MSRSEPLLDVWLVDLHRCASALHALELASPRLSDDENVRAQTKGDDGGNWRAQRIALRILLERYVGPEVRGKAFATGAKGKPQLAGSSDIHFSVSDCGPFALLAIARGGAIGVDIERPRALRLSNARRTAIVTAAGVVQSGNWPSGVRGDADDDTTVLQAWVRLEAWAKARSTGIGALLSDLGIWGSACATTTGISPGARAMEILRLERTEITDLALPHRLQGALACALSHGPIDVRDFPAEMEALTALEKSV